MILKAIRSGGKQTWNYRRIITIVYAMTLIFAALVAYPFKGLLESKAGHSLMVKDLIKGFDYTFLNDFLQNYGEGFLPIIDQSVLVIGLHFICLVFLMGGIIKVLIIAPPKYDRSLFWGAAGQYFWRMLRLTIAFLIIHALVLAAFFFLFMTITKGMSPEKLDSELIIVDTLYWLGPVYLLVGGFFFMWQDYSKLFLVRDEHTFAVKAMFDSFFFIAKNFVKTYGLFLLNIALLIILIYGNYLLSKLFDIQALSTIIWSFFLSQVFVISRLMLKIIRLASARWMVHSL